MSCEEGALREILSEIDQGIYLFKFTDKVNFCFKIAIFLILIKVLHRCET